MVPESNRSMVPDRNRRMKPGACSAVLQDKLLATRGAKGAFMLQVTLDKNDYIMIGDAIRIQYVRNNGANTFAIAVDAPREVKITRRSTAHLLNEHPLTDMSIRLETDDSYNPI